MTRRDARCALTIALLALGCASGASAQSNEIVARIGTQELRCRTQSDEDRDACARMLYRVASAEAQSTFIAENRLQATEAEIAELMAYNEAFERHDRSQRRRKLAELDMRLGTDLDPLERDRLVRFRAVLSRLARYEADVDAGLEQRTVVPADMLRRWVEAAKLDRALYARYGGAVGITAAGPYAHGARATLVTQYLAACGAQFLDADLERRLRAMLAAPPRLAFTGEAPDFTPFWKRPIPASYVAD